MFSKKDHRMVTLAIALAVAGALTTSGCSAKKANSPSSEPGGQASTSAKFYSLLPAKIQKAGTLNLGTDASAPPFASIGSDNKTIKGVNADLANAVGPLLGLKINLQNVAFDQSIPSVTTHRLDLYWDWSKDRPESRAKVDFIDFATTGAGMLVAEGNPEGIQETADLCGVPVAVQDGSSNVDIVEATSKSDCISQGKPAIEILRSDSVPSALLQIKGKRAKAVVTAYGASAYQGKHSPNYDLAGSVISPLKAGVTIAKDNTKLRAAVQAALQELIEDGRYGEIMDKWSLDGAKIDKITINDKA